jgi:hypothetical protein
VRVADEYYFVFTRDMESAELVLEGSLTEFSRPWQVGILKGEALHLRCGCQHEEDLLGPQKQS